MISIVISGIHIAFTHHPLTLSPLVSRSSILTFIKHRSITTPEGTKEYRVLKLTERIGKMPTLLTGPSGAQFIDPDYAMSLLVFTGDASILRIIREHGTDGAFPVAKMFKSVSIVDQLNRCLAKS